MIDNMFCPDCYKMISFKGMPFRCLLEDILEGYYLTNSPVAIKRDISSDYVLEYMEKSGYILTTEFPDPENRKQDIILAIPIIYFRHKDDHCFFCFDSQRHA